jgi:hypothetical protein
MPRPNDNVFKPVLLGALDDQLTEILRQGARTSLAQAVEAEVGDFLAKHAGLNTKDVLSATAIFGSTKL